jgi:uncharacterized protein YegL
MGKLLNADLETLKTASNYQFSAVKMGDLGASEYTLATIVLDVSGSVSGFKKELEQVLQSVVQACRKSPRAENLMLRLTTFCQKLEEVHGFKLLNGASAIQDSDYDDILQPGGMTALFDATHEAVEATVTLGRTLIGQDYNANGIVFVITDGMDNASRAKPDAVCKAIGDANKKESLESVHIVLVGVTGGDPNVSQYLDAFKQKAGITQYVDIGEATPKKLAKLGQFVSQSISSTSTALGSNKASRPVAFSI